MNKYDTDRQLQLLTVLKYNCSMDSYTTSKHSTNTSTACDTPTIKVSKSIYIRLQCYYNPLVNRIIVLTITTALYAGSVYHVLH